MTKPGESMARRWSVATIKATLSERLREVERGTDALITRNGKTIAALVPAADLERLNRLREAGPEGGLASIAGGWKGSDEVARAVSGLRRTPPRRRKVR